MRLLNFRIPDFLRVAWVSVAAREEWRPQFDMIQAAWRRVEWESVLHGVRECAILTLEPEDVVSISNALVSRGLFTLPLSRIVSTPGVYQSSVVTPSSSERFAYRLAVGRAAALRHFEKAWRRGDDDGIGELLGYPECCRASFRDTWLSLGLRDPTWVMAGGRIGPVEDRRTIEIAAAPLANVLARFIGVRGVPHLPCSFVCEDSVCLGRKMLATGIAIGCSHEMLALEAILQWSYEWSALHGIAEIRTQVVKVAVATDATADRHVVRIHGSVVPDKGARGQRFPYSAPRRDFVVQLRRAPTVSPTRG